MDSTNPTRPAPSSPPITRVGPAGWSYADWKGRVYPPRPERSFDALAWIARFFDTVEVNASFYRIPPASHALSWIGRIDENPRFRFAVKLHRSFTHEERGLDPGALRAFREYLRPLEDAERLGPILAQFPWSFRENRENRECLQRLADAFAPRSLAIEVRHGSWGRQGGRVQLDDPRLHPVSVDQPQVGDCLPPLLQEDDRLLYLRLHGRNEKNWFDRTAGRDARYDYRYHSHELRSLLAPLQQSSGPPRETYVITNNHFQGQAVINALEIRALLGEEMLEFPRWLEEEFPEIRDLLRQAGASQVRAVEPEATPGDKARSSSAAHDGSLPDPGGSQGDLFS